MIDLSHVILAGMGLVPAMTSVWLVVSDVRGRRVPSAVRVKQLRTELRAVRSATEISVEPERYRTLSIEMILHVARSEGFRLAAERRLRGRNNRPVLILSPIPQEPAA